MFVHWQDQIQLISKLTFNRLKNILKVVLGYILSRVTHRIILQGLPISITIEPTTACNLRCPECPSGLRSFTRPTGKIQTRDFEHIIDQVSDRTMYLTLYFQGEPFLNPGFLDMVEYASKKNMYVTTSTNAHFFDDIVAENTVRSGLSRLIISIDGIDQESYESYRIGGDLKKVIEGTKKVLEWKKRLRSSSPVVVWQFLVVRPNQDQIQELQYLGKELGVDKVALKTAQVYDYEHGNELIPTIDKYSRYRLKSDGTYEIKNQLLDHCWRMWSSSVITWDGKVIPCCFDKDAAHVMGELNNHSFKEIWNSPAYNNFRQAVIQSRSSIEMCQNCAEGTKIWA